MRAKPTVRRILLDLTPMIDIIMILLFGVMIHSVERAKVDTEDLRSLATQASEQSAEDRLALEQALLRIESALQENAGLRNQLDTLQGDLKEAKKTGEDLKKKMLQQRVSLSDFIAGLLQLNDAERMLFKLPVTNDSTKVQSNTDPEKVYKAIKRIEEMKKIFTFVDLHIDEQDFMTVNVDARTLERFPVRNRPPSEIEQTLRNALESASFNEVVLILFSYESQTLDRTVESVEQGIDDLLARYRTRWAGAGKQFRYGRVGLVETAPISVEEGVEQ